MNGRQARINRMLDLLREIEWAGTGGEYDDQVACCPVCGGFEEPYSAGVGHLAPAGHKRNCRLAGELR